MLSILWRPHENFATPTLCTLAKRFFRKKSFHSTRAWHGCRVAYLHVVVLDLILREEPRPLLFELVGGLNAGEDEALGEAHLDHRVFLEVHEVLGDVLKPGLSSHFKRRKYGAGWG